MTISEHLPKQSSFQYIERTTYALAPLHRRSVANMELGADLRRPLEEVLNGNRAQFLKVATAPRPRVAIPLATVIMMYPNILSLICILWILLVPCAARVIVRDTGQYCLMAQMNTDNLYNELTPDIEGDDLRISLAAICERCNSSARNVFGANRPRQDLRAVLNAAEARSTPANSALWQLNVHEKALPSRARAINHRANEPHQTSAGDLRQPTIQEGVASWQPVIKRTGSAVGGFLFEHAVHDKIADS
ncbi:hypothetical protein BDR06DRAFT_1022677 [Suillus hirtellus]|nr:hypothetical protein BDR06DRAFT_1022677 [Suillus hirtellus]